jgi:hypothetical protein
VPAALPRGDDLSLILEIVARVTLIALTNIVNEVAHAMADLSVV